MKVNRLFAACVLAPSLIATVYYGLIASDVYVSESRFVIRAPERQATSALGLVLKGAGFARSADDAYAVHDYIMSRDALQALNTELRVAKKFGADTVDRFSRFGGLDGDTSFEALHRYYEKHVDLQMDSASSIATLTVRAYSAEDALRINQNLLDKSEGLVNRLNERGRRDLVEFARSEVAAAEERAKSAALAVSAFRNSRAVVDPEKQATVQLQQIAKLQEELIATKTQLIQLQSVTADNPQIPVLKRRVKALETAVDEESLRVTGGTASLSNKATEYQRLVLENDFASRQLAIAMSALEQARNEANRKQLYLEKIVHPSHPDIAVEPKRLKSMLGVVLGGLMAWGVLGLLLASVREHAD
jgi:capsular polysaccharide transport system permease protein